jgi:SOS-response transcriptional repressor LexA
MRENELGSYLKLLRIKTDLTMTQTADITGITQGYISQIENGIYTPSAKTLAKLARAYKVPEIHLLRKAGIVQLSRPATTSDTEAQFKSNLFDNEPLADLTDGTELLTLLKRGLYSLEYLTDQLRQRGQVASLPSAPSILAGPDMMLGAEITLPVYDASWQPLLNAAGEAAGYKVPAHFAADDNEAFVLAVADNSMSPLITQGDWVVISPAATPQSGQIVALNDRNQLQLRSYIEAQDMLALTPLNPEFATRALVVDRLREKPEIAGRVLRIVNREL